MPGEAPKLGDASRRQSEAEVAEGGWVGWDADSFVLFQSKLCRSYFPGVLPLLSVMVIR